VVAQRDRRGRRQQLADRSHRLLEAGAAGVRRRAIGRGRVQAVGHAPRRGAALGERELALRPASARRERYALADGERELALLDGKGWGKRPVKVTVEDPAAVEPGLLLFATFVVCGLTEDAADVAGP
jgi:hypothetical protein